MPLSERDETLALCLATGQTRAAAAESVGMSERTVYARLARPEFAARVQELQAEILGRAVDRLASLAGDAADALGALLASPTEGVRLQASSVILSQLPRLREHVQLAARIAALEEAARQHQEHLS